MKNPTKTINSYYLIDEAHTEGRDFTTVVNEIMSIINQSSTKYKRQRPKNADFSPFRVSIFHNGQEGAPGWIPLVEEFVHEDAEILNSKTSKPSHIMFVGCRTRVFVITGGAGWFAIERFVSQRFGIDILCRLIKKDSPVIKGLSDRRLAGSLLGQAKEFRNEISLAQENNFGQVMRALKAGLNKEVLSKQLGIQEEDIKRNVSSCLAAASFRLNKSLNARESLDLISRLNDLLDLPPNFSVNNVEHLSGRKSASLRRKLMEVVEEQMFQEFSAGRILKFEFRHPESERFFSALSYEVNPGNLYYDEEMTLNKLLDDLKEQDVIEVGNIRDFKQSLKKIMLVSQDEDGISQPKRPIWDFICGEIWFEGEIYFLMNKEWYRIKPGFIRELNVTIKHALEKYSDDMLIVAPFDLEKEEAVFNMGFVGKSGCLVLDTVVADNIELCDLLFYGDYGTCMVHVKKGFGGTTSKLVSQVLMPARRLIDDIHTNFSYLGKIEDALAKAAASHSRNKRRLGSQQLPKGGLKALFKEGPLDKIYFCLAFADTAKKGRILKENPDLFESNMAKYILLNMITEITEMGFGLKIIQLKTTSTQRSPRKASIVKFAGDTLATSETKKKRGRPRKTNKP